MSAKTNPHAAVSPTQIVLRGDAEGRRFDGIGVVNAGANAVLLKDYPEPQRSQILDLVFKPKFGASVSALLVEIPGDGNSTQGSMPSHMHTRYDLDYMRGYIWWLMREATNRNPALSLDGTAWSAPGWITENESTRFPREPGWGDPSFWSPNTVEYYIKWLQGLSSVHGLNFDAIGCRNEKGVSYTFAKALRKALRENGFEKVKIHAFDNWEEYKFDFVKDLLTDAELCEAVDIIGAHTLSPKQGALPASAEVQEIAARLNKPIWNTEEHVYLEGFDCALRLVQVFNDNFLSSGATRIVSWYDIAALYPMQPYSETPSMLLARSPWSGHYHIREVLWGYAHYGQFTEVGWEYLREACGELAGGGSYVTLKSPDNGYSVIIETREAGAPQQLRFQIGGGLSTGEVCVWRSNAEEQFVRQADIRPVDGEFAITLDPGSIYSLSTTTGQQKGSFANVPSDTVFPFPYYETFDQYVQPEQFGHQPRYLADIAGVFEVVERPDGKCLRQVVPVPTISWAPDWQPYTILGASEWQDYEVSADVCLQAGDTAGVMGRINSVGTGFGFIPKGYFVRLADSGECSLVVIRGKKDKKEVVGDAEQQSLISASKDDSEGGEKVLGTTRIEGVAAGQWHNLKLRFEGETITALVDETVVLSATDTLYERGMAGLLAGQEKNRVSTPCFDNLLINAVKAPVPEPSRAAPGQGPIYTYL